MNEINLIGGFYKSKSLPFSAQDVVNWLPVPSKSEGSRSPIKLRGLPGLKSISSSVIQGLTITGDAPNATEDALYTAYSYTAAGGTGPYTFAISSGTLPDGLSMSSAGVITGTPTTPQTRSFTVRVSDASNQTAYLDDTIQIFAEVLGIVFTSATYNENASDILTFSVPGGFGAGDYCVLISASDSRTSTFPNFNTGSTPAFPVGDYVPLDGWSGSMRGGLAIAKLRAQDAPTLEIRTGLASAKNAAVVLGFIPAAFVDSSIDTDHAARFNIGTIGPITGGNVNSLVFSAAYGEGDMAVTSQAYPDANNITVATTSGSLNVKLSVNWAVVPSATFSATSFSGSNVVRTSISTLDLNGAAL